MKKSDIVIGIWGIIVLLFLPVIFAIMGFLYEQYENIFIITCVIFVLGIIFVRKVPKNTAIIVDRCTHYNKTVKRGFYIKVPFIDEITTKISTEPLVKRYSEVYETDDSKFVRFDFSVKYKAPDIEAVLLHLSADRRSIDDIIKCSIASTVKAFPYNYLRDIKREALNRTALNCSAFSIDILELRITSITNATQAELFKPHVHKNDGPISYR